MKIKCRCTLLCLNCKQSRRVIAPSGYDVKCHICKDFKLSMVNLGTKIRVPKMNHKNRWKKFLSWLETQPQYKYWKTFQHE